MVQLGAESSRSRLLIIGVGSPFGDDQAGWMVAQQLIARCQARLATGEISIEIVDRPGINLLAWLAQDYQKLILVDMVKTNLALPGKIYHLNGAEISGFSGMLSSHSLGVSAALDLALALNFDISKVEFWGIEGLLADPSATLSPLVRAAVDRLSELIQISITNLA